MHVIRARREDPAGVAQSRFENGSDKIPHQKLSRNRTCHRMGEKTHRKLEAGQNRVNSKAQRLSSKEGDFFHDRDGISQSMQRGSLSESSLRKRSQGHAGSRADPRKQGQWGNWNQESKEA